MRGLVERIYGSSMENSLKMSTLSKTWIFDLDGTLVKHNGYKTDGYDSLLDGVKKYIDSIPEEDFIIITTSRTDEYRQMTLNFLKKEKIRYNDIIFNLPVGERILINDKKPSGLDMAYAFNLDRDSFCIPEFTREK